MYSLALLLRSWRDLAGKKKEGGSEVNTHYCLKNKIIKLQIYIILNTIFVYEMFRLVLIIFSS
jgi:hypothetical protein